MNLIVANTAGNHQYAIVNEETGQDVGLVYNRSEQSKEIAQLMAAAPDMLICLKEAVDHAFVYDTNPNLIELFNAAIQKATQP